MPEWVNVPCVLREVQHHTETLEAEHESYAGHVTATLSEVEKAAQSLQMPGDVQSIRVCLTLACSLDLERAWCFPLMTGCSVIRGVGSPLLERQGSRPLKHQGQKETVQLLAPGTPSQCPPPSKNIANPGCRTRAEVSDESCSFWMQIHFQNDKLQNTQHCRHAWS